MGLEPTRYCYHKILSLARLPVPTLPHSHCASIILAFVSQKVNVFFKFYSFKNLFCQIHFQSRLDFSHRILQRPLT